MTVSNSQSPLSLWSYFNLRQMRQFYLAYGNSTDTVCQILQNELVAGCKVTVKPIAAAILYKVDTVGTVSPRSIREM